MEAAWAAWGCSGHGFLASKARSGLCCFRGFGIWGLGFRLLWFGGFRCSDGAKFFWWFGQYMAFYSTISRDSRVSWRDFCGIIQFRLGEEF